MSHEICNQTIQELEAQCAAMRKVLESVDRSATPRAWSRWLFERDEAIKPDAGQKLLVEIQALQGDVKILETQKGILKKQNDELLPLFKEMQQAIYWHRSQRADDRCIEDDDALYETLHDGIKCDRRVGNKDDMLRNCEKYIERRCLPGGWFSYRELEAETRILRNLLGLEPRGRYAYPEDDPLAGTIQPDIRALLDGDRLAIAKAAGHVVRHQAHGPCDTRALEWASCAGTAGNGCPKAVGRTLGILIALAVLAVVVCCVFLVGIIVKGIKHG